MIQKGQLKTFHLCGVGKQAKASNFLRILLVWVIVCWRHKIDRFRVNFVCVILWSQMIQKGLLVTFHFFFFIPHLLKQENVNVISISNFSKVFLPLAGRSPLSQQHLLNRCSYLDDSIYYLLDYGIFQYGGSRSQTCKSATVCRSNPASELSSVSCEKKLMVFKQTIIYLFIDVKFASGIEFLYFFLYMDTYVSAA